MVLGSTAVAALPAAAQRSPTTGRIVSGGVTPSVFTGHIFTGPGQGGGPNVRGFLSGGSVFVSYFAYDPSFTGGVRVGQGDVNSDGVPDDITAPGPGAGSNVKVFSGLDPSVTLQSFFAYDPSFTGGAFVASGDTNHNGWVDIVTGAGAGGGPHVKVFDGFNNAVTMSFFAYDPSFGGGVRVASGDINGDGDDDVITAPGPGSTPLVKVFSGRDGSLLASFLAYGPAFTGGVFVASGDVNGDFRADIVTGAGAGGGPHVKAFSGTTFGEIDSFFAYSPDFSGGVTVSACDLTNDGRDEIVTGAGPGGGPHVKAFDGVDQTEVDSFFAYDPSFAGGVFAACARRRP